ncbi:MAG: GTPase domain-containing protein [Clostridia bacterium]|nr:GTPase domain-containing protein [Clostridia bacterium]
MGADKKSLFRIDRKTRRGKAGQDLPVKIHAVQENSGEELVFLRICPHCCRNGKTNYLYPGQGEFPTYVVALAGARGVGKTTFVNAVRYPGNLLPLNEALTVLAPGLRIVPADSIGETTDVKTTNRSETGSTTLFDLTGNHKKIASLLIVDLAGELFEGKITESERGIFLEHADVLLVVDAADRGTGEVVSLYNGLKKLQYLDGIKSLCHVITCMDKVMDKKISYRGSSIPLFDKTTFHPQKKKSDYFPEEFLPRMALENMIVSNYRLEAGARIAEKPQHRAGFFIQTCRSEAQNPDAAQRSVYDTAVNIMDPLLWILAELGFLKIGREKAQ